MSFVLNCLDFIVFIIVLCVIDIIVLTIVFATCKIIMRIYRAIGLDSE